MRLRHPESFLAAQDILEENLPETLEDIEETLKKYRS